MLEDPVAALQFSVLREYRIFAWPAVSTQAKQYPDVQPALWAANRHIFSPGAGGGGVAPCLLQAPTQPSAVILIRFLELRVCARAPLCGVAAVRRSFPCAAITHSGVHDRAIWGT